SDASREDESSTFLNKKLWLQIKLTINNWFGVFKKSRNHRQKMKFEDETIKNDEMEQIAFFKTKIHNLKRNYSNFFNNNLFKKIASALFYALASMMIMFSNKIVLTKYKY
ncbi:hypothetical protein BpHYR1_053872, partial [Brachionus plicatilis]